MEGRAGQQMRWSVLVDKIVANARKYDNGDQTVQDYSKNYRQLIQDLSEEIRAKPYG